jgi:hypothetical protein
MMMVVTPTGTVVLAPFESVTVRLHAPAPVGVTVNVLGWLAVATVAIPAQLDASTLNVPE